MLDERDQQKQRILAEYIYNSVQDCSSIAANRCATLIVIAGPATIDSLRRFCSRDKNYLVNVLVGVDEQIALDLMSSLANDASSSSSGQNGIDESSISVAITPGNKLLPQQREANKRARSSSQSALVVPLREEHPPSVAPSHATIVPRHTRNKPLPQLESDKRIQESSKSALVVTSHPPLAMYSAPSHATIVPRQSRVVPSMEMEHTGTDASHEETSSSSEAFHCLTPNELTALYMKASRHDKEAYKILKGLVEMDNFALGFYMALYAGGFGVSQDFDQAEDISGDHLLPWLEEQSNEGESDSIGKVCAVFLLGICHYHGVNVTQDESEGYNKFRQIAAKGYAPAQFYMGHCFENGNGIFKRLSRAKEWYELAATQGHSGALCALGDMYVEAEGLAWADPIEAVRCYTIAAEQHQDVCAMNSLGWHLNHGIGAAKDLSKSAAYYIVAADRGYVPAMFNAGNCYDAGEGVAKDPAKAVQYFTRGAEGGNKDAMYRLAWCYDKGQGVDCQPLEALRLYRAAADEEDENQPPVAAAQNDLGQILQHGLFGVQKDHTEAQRLYHAAAYQGHGSAAYNLGYCYYHGIGKMKKDYKQAVKYYKMSADKENTCALQALGSCYEKGHGVEKDFTQSTAFYKESAELGHALAMDCLSNCYKLGQGITKSSKLAKEWKEKARQKRL